MFNNAVSSTKTIGKVLVVMAAGCLIYTTFTGNNAVAFIAIAVLAIYCLATMNNWNK